MSAISQAMKSAQVAHQQVRRAAEIQSRHVSRGEFISAAEAKEKTVGMLGTILARIQNEVEMRMEESTSQEKEALDGVTAGLLQQEFLHGLCARTEGILPELERLAEQAERTRQAIAQQREVQRQADDLREKAVNLGVKAHAAAQAAGFELPALPVIPAEKPKATVHRLPLPTTPLLQGQQRVSKTRAQAIASGRITPSRAGMEAAKRDWPELFK